MIEIKITLHLLGPALEENRRLGKSQGFLISGFILVL